MVSTANGNVEPVLSHQIRGDARVGHQKKKKHRAVWVHLELYRDRLRRWSRKSENLGFPCFLLLFPLQERKLKKLGEGRDVIVLRLGVHKTGLGVPAVTHPQ